MGGLIVVVLVIGFLIYTFIRDNEFSVQGKLQNREQAQAGATIVSAEPKIVGTKRSKHYVLVVTFSDGTIYQDRCSDQKNGWMKYTIWLDKEQIPKVLDKARKAHDQAVREKNQPEL